MQLWLSVYLRFNNDYRTATVAAAGLANQADYNYTVVFTPANLNNVATAFTLTATPIGAQVGDRCQTLTINQLGVTDAVDNTNASIANCW